MKICLTCLLALIALHVWGQGGNPSELGIGFAVAADPYQFEDGSRPSRLYRDPALKVLWTGREVAPFFNKADYGLYHFMCLAKTETSYKVLVNDHDTAYLPADGAFQFMTWEQLMIGYPMERHSTDNPIYERPSTSSKRVHHPCDPDPLYVKLLVERKGEYWAYVAMPLDCEAHADIHLVPCRMGWVKWRTANELLVSILLLC